MVEFSITVGKGLVLPEAVRQWKCAWKFPKLYFILHKLTPSLADPAHNMSRVFKVRSEQWVGTNQRCILLTTSLKGSISQTASFQNISQVSIIYKFCKLWCFHACSMEISPSQHYSLALLKCIFLSVLLLLEILPFYSCCPVHIASYIFSLLSLHLMESSMYLQWARNGIQSLFVTFVILVSTLSHATITTQSSSAPKGIAHPITW